MRSAILLLTVGVSAVWSGSSSLWTLQVDRNHSELGFTVPIIGGLSQVRGTFSDYDVEIAYDDADITSSHLDVTVRVASIDTHNDDRDEDLRGATFFDVTRTPVATFRSERIERTDSGYTAEGPLTIKGITRNIDLPFTLTGTTEVEGRPVVGLHARVVLNRKDFDLGTDWRHTVIPNFLGDSVTVEVAAVTRPGARETGPIGGV